MEFFVLWASWYQLDIGGKQSSIAEQYVRLVIDEDEKQDPAQDVTLRRTAACRNQGSFKICDANPESTVE